MRYLGDYVEDFADLNFKFTTHDDTGLPITLAGTPTLRVYKSNDTTQSTAGITLSVDFDSVTGLHNVKIDLSADAFYAVGEDYAVVVQAGTVDGISVVGYVVAHFSIEARTLSDEAIQRITRAVQPQINTAFANIEFLMVDSTDGRTPKTGLTVTGTVSIDGGAFGAVSGSIAEVANGIYQFDADAADMNGTIITFRFVAGGADATYITFKTTT